ncbi:MAG: tRNA guanosine(15) transglycosylase TgtA [Candidatus Bathyarchaeota archaeon]|nr:MAG: tRNA guanosine(15) transglycosylase TgtA [Candidatus Bathyarchaeota archaeon]
MVFEILDRDLAGRIGRFHTRRGSLETPLFLPVVNPAIQPFSAEEMQRKLGCQAIIANAFLLRKRFARQVTQQGIHRFLGFNGTIMTDSGGYQILVYGDVDVTPEAIARFQEDIDTDIAVILDIPTGWNASRERAEYTVQETLRRAKLTLNMRAKDDLLWEGPVQGGTHLDLVTTSAKQIGSMDFDLFALGSPTQVIERYRFDILVEMIVAAKMQLPAGKPLHLFGAGHPFMLSFAVALGCDIFDSAAYALFARQGKYLTEYGTLALRDLRQFPCSCEVCTSHTPQSLLAMHPKDRERLLAWHNLIACFTEINRIKQAIKTGRLWELLELRARSHPSLLRALHCFGKYANFLEAGTPISKPKGLLFYDATSLARPEITRYRRKILSWVPPSRASILVLLPHPPSKPFHRSKEYKQTRKTLWDTLGNDMTKVHMMTYGAPYGIIPFELDDIYPLSQTELAIPLDAATEESVAHLVIQYVNHHPAYRMVILQCDLVFSEHIKHAWNIDPASTKLIVLPPMENTFGELALNHLTEALDIAFKTY